MEESKVAIALAHGAIALPGLPSGLEHLAELVSLASLALGVLLSINAGRGFARRIHDVELARRHGEKLPGIGLLAYISLLLALMCNLAAFTASKTLSSIASLMGSIPLGGVASHLASLAVTVAVTLASYRFYAARYRGLDEPLTREGRLVLKSLGKPLAPKRLLKGSWAGRETAAKGCRVLGSGAPRILVAGMGDEPLAHVAWLADRLAEAYANAVVEVYSSVLSPPRGAYDPARGQYLSEMVLEEAARLRQSTGVDAVLVVASIDAYSPGLNFVFGQAMVGGGVAVVYTRRLRPEFYGLGPDLALYRERLLKEALHELGHAFGLGHCANPVCVMRFSNSIVEVDAKSMRYCRKCAARLLEAGIVVARKFLLTD